jgi:hypothetical protein
MTLNWGRVLLVVMMLIQISILIYTAYKYPVYKAVLWFAAIVTFLIYGGIILMIILANLNLL